MFQFREFHELLSRRRRDVGSGRWLPESNGPQDPASAQALPEDSDSDLSPAAQDPAAQDIAAQASSQLALDLIDGVDLHAASPQEPSNSHEKAPPGLVASAVWSELVALLLHQGAEARQLGGRLGYEEFLHAQFAMTALGDEIFLHETEWGASEAWAEHLLEARLFGSHRAGEQLFERIDELLDNAASASQDLARIYLATLALGFQGQYRGQSSADEILASYRSRLYFLVFQQEPRILSGDERIFPAAYASTLDDIQERRLPYLRPWIIVGLLLVVAWVAVSLYLWTELTHNLEPLVDWILDQQQQPLGQGKT